MNWLVEDRLGELKFEFMKDNEEILYFLSRYARSEKHGRIKSCAEESFKENNSNVGAIGLYACRNLIGVTTYELTPSKLLQGHISGKLDVVATVPGIRGKGLGRLQMANLYLRLSKFYGPAISQLLTTAVHPTVAHFVSQLGFTTPNPNEEGPLYSLTLENFKDLEDFQKKCRAEVYRIISDLRLHCIGCMSIVQPKKPWCRP